MRHYRCLTYYIPKTDSERVSYMTEIYQSENQLPILSQEDAVTHVAADLAEELQNPDPSILIPHIGEK